MNEYNQEDITDLRDTVHEAKRALRDFKEALDDIDEVVDDIGGSRWDEFRSALAKIDVDSIERHLQKMIDLSGEEK